MSTSIRWQERVHRPYDQVYNALLNEAHEIIQTATKAAAKKTETDIVSDLHTEIAGVEVHRDVRVTVNSQNELGDAPNRRIMIELEWCSIEASKFFPKMKAKLYLVPVGDEAQLDFRGEYDPPLGVVGKAIDAVFGEKIAQSSVHHFVAEIAGRLHDILPSKPQTAGTDAE